MTQQNNAKRQIDYLFQLSQQRSSEGREELYLCVADLFERQGNVVSKAERQIMKDILGSLTREVELSVRRKLATTLADNPKAPQELVMLLADDRIEVARPILLRSEILKNAELIEVIRHKSQAHQLAIAARQRLDANVSQALSETGDPDVVVALLENTAATISETILAFLADESRNIEEYQAPLLHREDLPAHLAKRMYIWVSAALRQYIARNYDIDVDDLDDALADTVSSLGTRVSSEDNPMDPGTLLINAVCAANELNEDFLMQTLSQGRIHIFEKGFATILKLDIKLTRQLLYDPGWEKLAIACKALNFSSDSFCTIQDVASTTRDMPDEYADPSPDTPHRFYSSLNAEDSMTVLRRIRRDSDLSSAIGMFSNL